jgi:hypothetical protein
MAQEQVTSMDKKDFALPQPLKGGSESTLSVSSGARGTAVAPPPSGTGTAGQLFEAEAGRLAGVLRVERWGEDGSCAPTFHIYLRPGDRETEHAVYEIKGQVYDRFPEAYLEVVVLEAIDGPPPNGEPAA